MYQSSARPPPSAVCILIKRAALIPASQNHHNQVVSCPVSGDSLGPRFSQHNPSYFAVTLCKLVFQSTFQNWPSSNIGWWLENCNILQLYKTAFKSTPQLIACENLESKCTINGLSLISIWWHCQKAWYDIKPTNCKQKPFLFLCQIVNQFTLN